MKKLQELTRVKAASAEAARHLMKDHRSLHALEAAVAFGNGEIALEELNKAIDEADKAVNEADAASLIAYALDDAADSTVYADAAYAAYAAACAAYAAANIKATAASTFEAVKTALSVKL
jgi:hypothetical protein